MKWLFNSNSLNLKNGKVSWDQARNFKGSVGDEVIFFDYSQSDGNFTSLYRIEEVISKPQNDKPNSRYDIEVTLSEVENYKKGEKEFADYVYSFPRVKNFGYNLWRHFNRKYYRISEMEFDAIIKDDIFFSRTFLGSAVNALHQEHRRAFVLYVIQSNPEYLFGKYNYQDLYVKFHEYVDFAIIRPAHQLKDGYSALSEITGQADADNAVFISESTKESNNISAQVEIINTQFEQIEKGRAIDLVQVRQEKFEFYFKNAQLPFNLN